jgi:type II restriction/modification system DNA methylase subunit YeeA
MAGFDDGAERARTLDGKTVEVINSNLTANADFVSATSLRVNERIAFIGTTKGGDFDIPENEASRLLHANGNPHGKPNSDVVVPIYNGFDILNRAPQRWLINNEDRPLAAAALYEEPHSLVLKRVKPSRDHNRNKWLKENWWKLQRMRPEMRAALAPLRRFIASPRVSKHRVFIWFQWPEITDDQTVVFARDDDFFFGVIHSRTHEAWALSQGTQVRERESGFRYTPTTCFDNFSLPQATPEQEVAIAAAAKELNELRERWLNPPEWTKETILEFPGSADGPWARYVVKPDKDGIGTVRYPRLEPKDADSAKKLKERTLTKLYNERPTWLDLAHKKLDQAVAAAYDFPADLTDEQILERLLKLNLERAAEEAKAAQVKKPKTSRTKRADEML